MSFTLQACSLHSEKLYVLDELLVFYFILFELVLIAFVFFCLVLSITKLGAFLAFPEYFQLLF